MHHVHDKKFLLDFNSPKNVLVPANLFFLFNISGYLSLVPSHLFFDQGRHFVLEKDEKYNRGAPKLLHPGALQLCLDLEIENAL